MRLIVFDFETTGLTLHRKAQLSKQPRAIEFGGALLVDGVVTETKSLLINPRQPLEVIITKITGLTDAALADKPVFGEVLSELRALFEQADGMVAHNLPFDRAILTHELQRLEVTDFPWPQVAICTAQSFQEEWGRRPKMLELYAEVTGRPLMQTHRALDDVLALVEIVQATDLNGRYEKAIARR